MERRKFIRSGAGLAAGFFIVPPHVLGGKGKIPPSDKLDIAAIGTGGKGMVNLNNSWNNGSDNIVALCDVDDRMSAEARKKWPRARYFRDYREMLDRRHRKFDAVIVSTPDHMHAVQAMAVLEHGKHLYCEKPLTHDIREARKLTEAAAKFKVVTQMGNQGSSGDSTRKIEAWIQSGLIGEVRRVHIWTNRPVWPQGISLPEGGPPVPAELSWDLWLGTAKQRAYHPAYLPATWRGWVDFGTGALGDMGCHFIDVPYRALKLAYPVAVECSIGAVWNGFFEEAYYPESYPPSSKIHLQFPARGNLPEVELIWYDGGILPKRPKELKPDEQMGEWDGGIIFEGSKAKLMAGLFGRNPTLLPTALMQEASLPAPQRPLVDGAEEGHQQQWVRACKEGYGAYTSSSFDAAGPLTETVLMGNLAILSYMYREKEGNQYVYPGRKQLLWDGEAMRITNFEPANRLTGREYRQF
ncbi:oxidoreductase family protein [Anseongella ginsenosidimutans]|uniref:Oxidoreductase family protein n=1 Tax=Anseongella ginsenosidimutans TaxID=496056 RepID=A0A4R3KMR5_9SPHI|nr:Gfo/Idh/MocA family oxidoreductase [Anseongella ginsenosidimutans]QEC54073.1 Gfo/Idh/MocA family oxidoreductase [Anseongella ginsenosidimutans]TCS85161.1 oxidoreductase family protein [Anseongella ginsenosidimutans]